MESLTKLLEVGEKLGLSGKELLDFIESREKLEQEKEEKMRLREEQKEIEKRERDEKKEKESLEREERMKERELKQKSLEIAHAENVSKLKIQLAEKEVELAEIHKMTKDIKPLGGHDSLKAKLPKLPAFCEGKDNMDSYLKRFERFALNAGWHKDEWATNLSALLQGKALDVYSRLSPVDAVNYDALKDALLTRFQLTEEGFRVKFRTGRQESGETASQFVVRLSNYLSRWMELGKVPENYEGLRDLMLREQFLAVSNKSLVMFLKERKLKSVKEMTELADQYIEAHGFGEVMPRTAVGAKPDSRFEGYKGNFQRNTGSENSIQPRGVRVCYNCGNKDHFIRDCPLKPKAQTGKLSKAAVLQIDQEETTDMGCEKSCNKEGEYSGEEIVKSVATCMAISHVSNVPIVCHSMPKCRVTGLENTLPFVSITDSQKIIQTDAKMPVVKGYVGEQKVSVLRDSGCNTTIVKESLISEDEFTGNSQKCRLADGTIKSFRVAMIQVDTPYLTGRVEALCMENPVYDLVIGNIKGVRSVENPDLKWIPTHNSAEAVDEKKSCSVETRAQRKKDSTENPLHIPDINSKFSREDIIREQEKDESLARYRSSAETGEKSVCKTGAQSWYQKDRGLYYRKYQAKADDGKIVKQLLVPKQQRLAVLRLAHDAILSGHMGVRKTKGKILTSFWWPGVDKDVRNYCRSCDICQKTVAKGRVSMLPLGKMPVIDTPFSRVAIDLIGPIHPPSDNGNRFILTVVDYATRYPEAKPLQKIDTETVAEALVDIYSRVGIPREVLTDQGKQFTSDLMKEVGRLLSVKQLTTTPYHPSCNGLVERFNGTLKSMLRRVTEEKPRQWDRYIPALLFAYRDSVQESTGFSPFQLLYGRQVRGPLTILRELWTKEIDDNEIKTTYQYVVDLREKLESSCEIAREELEKNSKRYKTYADAKSKDRQFKAGEDVLLLLPNNLNKLLMQWKGPFRVVEKINPFDYRVNVKGKVKTYHGNMLKKYFVRDPVSDQEDRNNHITSVCVSVIEHEDTVDEECREANEYNRNEVSIQFPTIVSKETLDDVKINTELDTNQAKEVSKLLKDFSDVFTDIPGTTDLVEHDIVLTSSQPVRSRPYPVPYALKHEIRKEIDNMLDMDIIQPCTSSYASPVVIVKKSDGTNRFCCDFRKLNQATVFDAEPVGNPDELFASMSKSKYFTKLDLSKGYWQIKVKSSCQHLTAFITSEGLYSFKKMPFGLVNSGATFCRMMRKLLRGLRDVDNFVDDIIVHTETWEVHVRTLCNLLKRLREAKLTARPSKCVVAVTKVGFLGHILGNGTIQPNPEKVISIQNCKRPVTKKQVRSFIGLIGYYRRFIPNFSSISAPLTDLTKKGLPTKVRWQEEQEVAFQSLIALLSKSPILCLPEFSKEFIVRTDASDIGIGAVLLQEHDGSKFPIFYASKKLSEREKAYAVVEKECLALVWAVQKFQSYLYGKQFILETDHEPLVYINKAKCANARMMRWALALQPFNMRVVGIKGSENVGADFLSRIV